MKKIVLLSMVLLLGSSAAMADCEYKCVEPYGLNNKFRTISAAVTGFNSIVERKVESIIKKEVLKISTAKKLDISLQSYSPKDLKGGIFKSFNLQGSNLVMNDVHLTELNLATLCNFNYIEDTEDGVIFREDLPMSFDMTFTQDDLNNTFKHDRYQMLISDINAAIGKYVKGLSIASTKVAIKSGKFYYIIGFNVPFLTSEQKVVIQSDLNIKDGDIDLTNTKIVSGHLKLDARKLDYLMTKLNPLEFAVNVIENKNANVYVKDVEIVNNEVVAKGIIVIPKN